MSEQVTFLSITLNEIIGALEDCIYCGERNGHDYLLALQKSISYYKKLKEVNKCQTSNQSLTNGTFQFQTVNQDK